MKKPTHIVRTIRFYLVLMFVSFGMFCTPQLLFANYFKIKNLSIDQGLSHTDALCMVQDSTGFIWIGTFAGLNRYDGYRFEKWYFKPDSMAAPLKNRITSIAYNRQNNLLWLGSQGGLTCFDINIQKYIPIKSDNPAVENAINAPIEEVVSINDSMLFMITSTATFFAYHTNQNRLQKLRITKQLDQFNRGIRHCKLLDKNRIVLSCDNLLTFYDVKNHSVIDQIRFDESFKIGAIKVWNGKVILGSENCIAILENLHESCKNSVKRIVDFTNSNGHRQLTGLITSIETDIEGAIWVGSSKGLFRLKNSVNKQIEIENYAQNRFGNSIPSCDVTSILSVKSGCLFVGSYLGGISVIDLLQKPFYGIRCTIDGNSNSATETIVTSIAETNDGNLWIGTRSNGLLFCDIEQSKITTVDCACKNIRTILLDGHNLWIGATDGIFVFDTKVKKLSKIEVTFPSSMQLQQQEIHSLAKDCLGNIWATTLGKMVVKISNNSKCNVVDCFDFSNDSLQFTNFSSVYALKHSNMLLLATNNGLYKLSAESKMHNVDLKRITAGGKGLKSNFIWPIYGQTDTIFWVGTLGGGLSRIAMLNSINGENETLFRTENFSTENSNIPSDDIESVLMDNAGNVWFAGKGISKLNTTTKIITNYETGDGLNGNVFKVAVAHKGKSGRLYFGGIGGFTYFDPQTIGANKIRPTTLFSKLEILDNPVTISPFGFSNLTKNINNTTHISLDHNQNDFKIFFSVSHFANPAKNSYQYKLFGFDKEWKTATGENPHCAYRNLDYGKYRLEVNSFNNDGLKSEIPKTIYITILPPFWLSIWAKLIYLMLSVILIYLIYSYRLSLVRMKHELEIKQVNETKKEELHQMKLRFFTNISHEFRTPLTLILGPVDSLLSSQQTAENQRNYLTLIKRNATILLKLVNDIMDFRKTEVATVPLNYKLLNVANALRLFVEPFEMKAREMNLNFVVNSTIADNETLFVDEGMFQQIIYNLLSNALNYTDKGGSIEITATNAALPPIPGWNQFEVKPNEELPNEAFIYIAVKDNGLGISEESLPKLFERFYQTGNSGARMHQGSGVGLALTKNLVLLHKGYIVVESCKNCGTRFTVALPRGSERLTQSEFNAEPKNEPLEIEEPILFRSASLSEHQTENSAKKTILLVEDNADLQQFLKANLENEFNLVIASDGEEGCKAAFSVLPDMIISDVMMPRMNGLELTAKIKNSIETNHIPVILLTAKSSIESHISGIESGADLYLPKPFSMELLQKYIESLLQNRQKVKDKFQSKQPFDIADLPITKNEKVFIDEVFKCIKANISDSEFNVQTLSNALAMSRSSLLNKLKSCTGLTVAELIRNHRLEYAVTLLKNSDLSISEIAYSTGFTTPSHFGKVFKERFGTTPGEYANLKKN